MIWTIDPATNLAVINSLTGVVTALGNGMITVKATSLVNGVSGQISVNISGQNSPPKVSVSTNEIKFDFTGGELSTSKQFEIVTNGSWKVKSNVSWITVSPESGLGNATVTITVNNIGARYENIQDFERSGILSITVGTEVKTISIVQKGAAPLAVSKERERAELIISPNPSNGSFTVDNTGSEALNYKIINSIGIVVGEGKLNVAKNIFSLNLAKGVYLFLMEAGSKKISIE